MIVTTSYACKCPRKIICVYVTIVNFILHLTISYVNNKPHAAYVISYNLVMKFLINYLHKI